ncbi:MAG: Glu/Leu/Phe/Val dehydrogenase, partial [Thermoanaerobaculia bacterium]|nr:Glu/Leu/Phe/Val dehydrogenase [Thermoanaerobaculia bacterium]
GTGPREMAWIYEAYSREHGDTPGVVTGKPIQLGGSLGRVEATGRGVGLVSGWAASAREIDLEEATVAIQGFGNVGRHAACELADRGGTIVAVSTAQGGLYREDGLDVDALCVARDRDPEVPLQDSGIEGDEIGSADPLAVDADLVIPAAIEEVITGENAGEISASLVVEAANMPVTSEAHDILEQRGIPVIPDILANAGGVIVSYLETVQNRQRYRWSRRRVNREQKEILESAWENVEDRSEEDEIDYRTAAWLIAVERVLEATELRGL